MEMRENHESNIIIYLINVAYTIYGYIVACISFWVRVTVHKTVGMCLCIYNAMNSSTILFQEK